MEAIFVLSATTTPCVVFLVWCLTPSGKKWLKENHMIRSMGALIMFGLVIVIANVEGIYFLLQDKKEKEE